MLTMPSYCCRLVILNDKTANPALVTRLQNMCFSCCSLIGYLSFYGAEWFIRENFYSRPSAEGGKSVGAQEVEKVVLKFLLPLSIKQVWLHNIWIYTHYHIFYCHVTGCDVISSFVFSVIVVFSGVYLFCSLVPWFYCIMMKSWEMGMQLVTTQ